MFAELLLEVSDKKMFSLNPQTNFTNFKGKILDFAYYLENDKSRNTKLVISPL